MSSVPLSEKIKASLEEGLNLCGIYQTGKTILTPASRLENKAEFYWSFHRSKISGIDSEEQKIGVGYKKLWDRDLAFPKNILEIISQIES